MRDIRCRLLLAFGLILPCAALAQTTPSSPGTGNAPAANEGPTLTDKLNRTDGVITPPPSGDQEMTLPPPQTGAKTPVIPPSAVDPKAGEPGEPRPQPK